MKLKKNVKIFLLVIFIILFLALSFLVYKVFFSNQEVEEAKVINSIKDYGYTLKDNKDAKYKKMFDELKEILETDKVDYDKYAMKISEMFIYDFYSLDNKIAKNDIGGVDFVHPDVLSNFLENAESTYYKYVESNIYGNRNQKLPLVDEITVETPVQTEFALKEKNIDDAYKVQVTWTYTDSEFSTYQQSATIILVKEDKKLNIVQLTNNEE